MSKKSRLVTFVLAMVFIIISIRSASPPAVRLGDVPDTAFSVQRAYTHLLQISRMPHSTGTADNARVREYIVSVCKQLGFTVEIQNTTSFNNWGGYVNAANIYNIVAVKKGLHNSKSVLLMAHYDSEPNTPGAGDDGAGVAAILETARTLQKIDPLQNDLILLLTDGEEIGLLGATAFVKESPLVKGLGLVINFEGRGNAGPSNMFEVNADNGWAINEYAKSVAHPFANSLGYEIYKKLPNGTDFTPFKNAGITGLNNAYIDGFVNYHSPEDKPENMDMRSLQHHGDNMLSLAKHFGNLLITKTKAPDVSYFNVIGNWFVHYPASWNLIFVLFTDLLFVLFIVSGIKNKSIKIGASLLSTLLFPVVLAIIYFVAKYLLKYIYKGYPLYSHFDEHNSYNSYWYFLAMSALAFTIFSFIYYLVAKKINFNSLFTGILLLVILLMNGMQYAIPSASYLLSVPLLFILLVRLFLINKKVKDGVLSNEPMVLNLIGIAPAICLLVPTVYATFIAFSLGSNMPFVVIATGICAGLLFPVMYPILTSKKLLLPLAGLACFAGCLLGGHLSAGYSKQHPLQSHLRYILDADSSKAKWLTDFTATDKFSATFFKNGDSDNIAKGYKQSLINDAPILPLPSPVAVIIGDTLSNGKRKLVVHFNTTRENVNQINISISDSSKVSNVFIDGKQIEKVMDEKPRWYKNISYAGITGKGVDIIFEMEPNKKLDIIVSDLSIGLPVITGFSTTFPVGIIPARGSSSNTIQVTKHVVL